MLPKEFVEKSWSKTSDHVDDNFIRKDIQIRKIYASYFKQIIELKQAKIE